MQLTRGHRTQALVAMRFAVLLSLAGLFLGVLPGAAAAENRMRRNGMRTSRRSSHLTWSSQPARRTACRTRKGM